MDVQNAAIEIREMLQQAIACDLTNTVHTAKMARLGEFHLNKAKSFYATLKVDVAKAKREANDCKTKGIKNISNAISGPRAKPLTCVCAEIVTHRMEGRRVKSPPIRLKLMQLSSGHGEQSTMG